MTLQGKPSGKMMCVRLQHPDMLHRLVRCRGLQTQWRGWMIVEQQALQAWLMAVLPGQQPVLVQSCGTTGRIRASGSPPIFSATTWTCAEIRSLRTSNTHAWVVTVHLVLLLIILCNARIIYKQESALAAKHPRPPTSARAHRASAPAHVPYPLRCPPNRLPSVPSTPPDVSCTTCCRPGSHDSPSLYVTRSTSATGVSLAPALASRPTRRAVDSIGLGMTDPDAHPPLPTLTCVCLAYVVLWLLMHICTTLVPSSKNL